MTGGLSGYLLNLVLEFLGLVHDLTSTVVPTIWTGVVRHAHLFTLRTLHQVHLVLETFARFVLEHRIALASVGLRELPFWGGMFSHSFKCQEILLGFVTKYKAFFRFFSRAQTWRS